jgi:hypothetical protein
MGARDAADRGEVAMSDVAATIKGRIFVMDGPLPGERRRIATLKASRAGRPHGLVA